MANSCLFTLQAGIRAALAFICSPAPTVLTTVFGSLSFPGGKTSASLAAKMLHFVHLLFTKCVCVSFGAGQMVCGGKRSSDATENDDLWEESCGLIYLKTLKWSVQVRWTVEFGLVDILSYEIIT